LFAVDRNGFGGIVYDAMKRFATVSARVNTLLFAVLAGCSGTGSNGTPPPFCCPAQPPNMLVAERGANEIAVYPRRWPSSSPSPMSTIPAPGAESFTLAIDTVPMSGGEGSIGFQVLYVGEYPATVAVIDSPYAAVNATITAGISDPAALAASTINGYEALFVANRGANDVVIYESENLNFSSPTVTIPGLNAPDGLAFDAQGDLWVAQASSVVEFTPPFTANSTPAVTITDGLKSPSGIAFDQSGSMYVADKGDNAIAVYPSGSVAPSATVTAGIDGPGNLLIGEQGFYFSNDLFVPNVAGNSIAAYSLPLTSTSKPFVTISRGMNEPSAVTFLTISN
jgi:hypothetical protein